MERRDRRGGDGVRWGGFHQDIVNVDENLKE